ncbi:MAG: hypothetical protein K2J82_07180 [Muribaculaceae bacterium]|nr:hypothetical protein [Muribaculaceae bacterium]MDE6754377.1 hypothetical protein [Muribaculaceae bacterium]
MAKLVKNFITQNKKGNFSLIKIKNLSFEIANFYNAGFKPREDTVILQQNSIKTV